MYTKKRSHHYQNAMACKDKWNGLYREYKKIWNQQKGIGFNKSYWTISVAVKEVLKLPKDFMLDLSNNMDSFLKDWPTQAPLHGRDFIAPNDHVYYSEWLEAKDQNSQPKTCSNKHHHCDG